MLTAVIAFSLLQAASGTQAASGVRNPAYAPDGRLAVSVRGDIWVISPANTWTRITAGAEWDREPTWSRDGSSIVFASNKSGNFDIWQVSVGTAGATAAPVRLTTTADNDAEPAIDATGRILFVRGRGSDARIWVREGDATEHRFTIGRAAERWPAASPDGRKVAYVIVTETARRLVVRLASAVADARGADSTVVSLNGLEHPAWSPAANLLTYTTGGGRPSLSVTPLDGRYQNFVAPRHAESAWSPDGKRLALTDLRDELGYNGDPDRIGNRENDPLFAGGPLSFISAPVALDSAVVAQASMPTSAAERSAYNGDVFDGVWQRTRKLYYDTTAAPERKARWDALREKYRPRALASTNEDELRTTIHAMMRERPPFRVSATGRAAVSSAHPVATAAGVEIFAKGGNVADAAAAVSLALGVVEPDASGLGGYGQMLVYKNGMTAPKLIEFMTRVPEDAGLTNGDLAPARLPDDGPVLINVPGTLAAMHLAFKQYGSGKVSWADIVAPAIRAAKEGYAVSEGLATTLATEREHFAKYEGSRALFFRNGKPVVAGDTIKNPDLAWTLEQIAKGGADAFYKGEVARRLVSDLHGKGNAMKLTDLSRYYAAEREPIASTYRDYSFYSSAPPVSGGASLAGTMNNLEQFPNPKPYTEDAATMHAMISAWLLGPSSRNRIADPGLWPVNTEPFTNKDTARVRWRCFNPSKPVDASLFRGDSLVCGGSPAADGNDGADHGTHSTGTTSFTVADGDGNIVTVTQTLGTWGGSFYVSPGLGFLYNDKLGSYGTDPSAYGARLPFARHGSTLAPTIVFGGTGPAKKPLFAFGAAGNNWITSAVYQVFAGMADQNLDPQAALELPRFQVSRGAAGRGPTIQMEDGFSPAVVKRLEELGYRVEMVSLLGEVREGYGSAIRIKDGKVTAGADPRRSGAAGSVP